MHSRSKVDEKKAEQERLQNILLEMLKENENKYCADCQAKTPRWASWNLGVFICIRCAGIHRNLGVHISKVRSVNLDSWSAEQVQSMRVMGNEKARMVYEHSLPDYFRRSMADHQLEQFIRAKYEQKRYMLADFVYPKVDINDLPKLTQGTKRTPTAIVKNLVSTPSSVSSTSIPPTPCTLVNDLVDLTTPPRPLSESNGHGSGILSGEFSSLPLVNQPTQPTAASSDLDDMFGSYVSASSTVSASLSTTEHSCLNGSEMSTEHAKSDLMGLTTNTDEKKSNADILSLFGGSGQTQIPTQPIIAPGGFAAFGMQPVALPQQTMQCTTFGVSSPALANTLYLGGSTGDGKPPLGQPAPVFPGFSGVTVSTNPTSFPNPFGPSCPGPVNMGLSSSHSLSSPHPPISKTTNAFADLSLGKVMNMNYMSGKTTTPPPAKPVAPANMNFDDLLGL